MRLKSSDAERNSNVAIARCNEVIQIFDFFDVTFRRGSQFRCTSADRLVRLNAIALQTRIPAADFVPRLEGTELNIRDFIFIVLHFLLLFFFEDLESSSSSFRTAFFHKYVVRPLAVATSGCTLLLRIFSARP